MRNTNLFANAVLSAVVLTVVGWTFDAGTTRTART